jgi:glycerophosphoryl diester phosphodiesterase
MLGVPLLIGYRQSAAPLLDVAKAVEWGCQGVCFDLQLRPFGSSRSTQARTTRYPRLKDIFDHYGENFFLNIGIPSRGMEAEILDVVRQRRSQQNYVLSSALPEVVMELKLRSETVPVGLVCKRPSELAMWRHLPSDYVMVHYPLITRKLVRMVHQSARKIFAWTVDDLNIMTRLSGWGIDGIISSDPRLLSSTPAVA